MSSLPFTRASENMSPPETPAHVALTAQDVLSFNEDQLVQLVNECRTERGDIDLSRVVGVDGLSESQREAFAQKWT